MNEHTVEATVMILNKMGLHARPASQLDRFLVAGLFIFGVLISQRQFPDPRQLSKSTLALVLFASVMLVLNYTTNVIGLDYLNPETVQVIMQLAPFLLMLGGVVIFKERFTRFQTFGAGVLLIGMMPRLFLLSKIEATSRLRIGASMRRKWAIL